MPTEGIDISRWQPTVNWPEVKAAGTLFAYIKATDGEVVKDPRFIEHWAGAKGVGLLRGAYHFFQPHLDPYKQAVLLIQTLGADPGELPPALDLEETRVPVDNITRIRAAEICLKEIERLLQRRPVIYTGPGFWNGSMYDPVARQYPAWASGYDLWVANYPYADRPPTPEEVDRFKPLIPRSWTSWVIWQYTGLGKLAGIKGPVDRDRFNGAEADLLKWAGRAAPIDVTPIGDQPHTGETPVNTTPITVVTDTVPQITNQQMINGLSRAFGANMWSVMSRAGLINLATPYENRAKPYAGPPVSQLPNLTDAEKAAINDALAQIKP